MCVCVCVRTCDYAMCEGSEPVRKGQHSLLRSTFLPASAIRFVHILHPLSDRVRIHTSIILILTVRLFLFLFLFLFLLAFFPFLQDLSPSLSLIKRTHDGLKHSNKFVFYSFFRTTEMLDAAIGGFAGGWTGSDLDQFDPDFVVEADCCVVL